MECLRGYEIVLSQRLNPGCLSDRGEAVTTALHGIDETPSADGHINCTFVRLPYLTAA